MRRTALMLSAAVAVVAACETPTVARMGQIDLRLTDAPSDTLSSATVWISKVYLAGGDSGRVVISDTAAVYDLLSLQGGVTAALGSKSIPVGDYEQLRLVVDSADVVLKPGLTFADGSTSQTLRVPSGMQTGIKVSFAGPIHVAPGETDLVVDFDVARSFVFMGTSGKPDGILFKPVIHASTQDVAGSISGTSLPDTAHAHLFAISGSDTVATTTPDSAGAYSLWFLPPGTYAVADQATGFKTQTQTVTVGAAEHVTGVNFTLAP